MVKYQGEGASASVNIEGITVEKVPLQYLAILTGKEAQLEEAVKLMLESVKK